MCLLIDINFIYDAPCQNFFSYVRKFKNQKTTPVKCIAQKLLRVCNCCCLLVHIRKKQKKKKKSNVPVFITSKNRTSSSISLSVSLPFDCPKNNCQLLLTTTTTIGCLHSPNLGLRFGAKNQNVSQISVLPLVLSRYEVKNGAKVY